MLVLTRKLNESIQIGEDIRITVVRIKGNTVRIGIEAPQQVRVVRGELQSMGDRLGGILEDRVRRGESVVVEREELESAEEFTEDWSLTGAAPVGAGH